MASILYTALNTGITQDYLVSAECPGFKTRTYTGVTPYTSTDAPTPCNLYLTPMRKLILTAGSDSCGCVQVVANVVNSDHTPDTDALTVRFITNSGYFAENGLQLQRAAVTTTTGTASVTLYSNPYNPGQATVMATGRPDHTCTGRRRHLSVWLGDTRSDGIYT